MVFVGRKVISRDKSEGEWFRRFCYSAVPQIIPTADKVHVIRPLRNSHESAVIQLNIREARNNGRSNISLGPGDVVSVE